MSKQNLHLPANPLPSVEYLTLLLSPDIFYQFYAYYLIHLRTYQKEFKIIHFNNLFEFSSKQKSFHQQPSYD